MAFRFPLATLLRLREIAEQREERLLGQIQNQIAQSRLTLEEIARRRKNILNQREQALNEKTSGVGVADFYGQSKALERVEMQTRDQLAKLIVLRDQQSRIYQVASRSREVLSGMRDDQKAAFCKDQTKLEQKALDDSFSSRLKFR